MLLRWKAYFVLRASPIALKGARITSPIPWPVSLMTPPESPVFAGEGALAGSRDSSELEA
jgi:hypothetical protein